MREVEEHEMRRWHCIMCGSTNKLLTVYSYYGEPKAAASTRCCNCGQETFFSDPNRVFNKSALRVSHRKCLMGRACYNYNCPLHPKHGELGKKITLNNNECCIKNQIYPELTVNLDERRYK